MSVVDLEHIKAQYAERQQLRTREMEICALPIEDITPALDAEALECLIEWEHNIWCDEDIAYLLAEIERLNATLDGARAQAAEDIGALKADVERLRATTARRWRGEGRGGG